MKRLIKMLLILCLFYVLIQLGFKYFGNGHTVTYKVKGNDYSITINEVATFNKKNETDHYYFTFMVNDKEFYLQTYQTFKKNDYVIKDVKYFKNNNYECIYPIFSNKELITDILCESGNTMYHYHDLKGKSGELDKFAKDLESEGYDDKHWDDDTTKEVRDEKGPIIVYPNNLIKKHYIGVDYYAGIYLINNYLDSKSLYKIEVFQNDQYERMIEGRAGRYYIVANYLDKHDFNVFFLVDMVYNDQKTIKYHSRISFNSYIQGTVDDTIYLFDRDSKKQYKIDSKAGTIVEVGNEKMGIKYYNAGNWENRKAIEAVNATLYFNEYPVEKVEGFEKIDKIGNDLSGYYYYYRKINNHYDVYRASIKNKDQLTYLFTTTNINEIQYLKDYIYYKEGNYIKYYHDMTGVRTVVYNSEFEFNKSIQYYIYHYRK